VLGMFLQWDQFLFPKIVKILYLVGLAVIAVVSVVAALGALVGGFAGNQVLGGLIGFLVAIVVGGLGLVMWRVYMELLMVLFSIHDKLTEIRDQGRRPAG
jgi:hypothetical protein